MLHGLLVYGCKLLFASPSCTPWGNNSRGWEKTKLQKERATETPTLQFLAVMCLLQVIIGGSYMIENPKNSDIYKDSPLALLEHESLPSEKTVLDQCAYGASMDGGLIRKSTEMRSDGPMTELNRSCSGEHEHVHLRGTNKRGSRTAQAAVYPDELCQTIVDKTVKRVSTTQSGGENKHQCHKAENKKVDFGRSSNGTSERVESACATSRTVGGLGSHSYTVVAAARA